MREQNVIALPRAASRVRGFAATHRQLIGDALLVIAILSFTVPTTVLDLSFSLFGPIPDWIEILVEVITVGTLLIRRRTALPMIISTVVCAVLTGQIVPMAFAAYSMTAENKVRHWQLVGIPLVVAGALVDFVSPGTDNFLYLCVIRALTLVYLPALVGTWVRGYRGMIGELRAGVRERERQAASLERRKIARELHDTVTHAVTTMVLNAGIIQTSREFDEVARVAASIEDKGVQALAELRELLTVLRREDDRPPAATRARSIPHLVEEADATGMRVDLQYDLPEAGLPTQVGHACYRVVQEGLNNVRKHAPCSDVRVVCETCDDVVKISVVNGGDGGPPALGFRLPNSGHGLAGLAERVALLNGRLDIGPTAEGGFELTARIPLPDEGAASALETPGGESAAAGA
ncbi:hypothetical protein JOL79_14035 [Microbispora sp. RL4-1S]|uniref:histidine kinase n=1 Tax=Microbispora oryzae TaxID=2806554 RepID=A0A941AIA1_9ACTN|nr:histidine kinase [Microbispora oryzae]MBP2704936.1 hypothetical protein [Microbispora oryzae]